MTSVRFRTIISLVIPLGLALPREAPAQVSDPLVYSLRAGSAFQYGCFGPCDCIVRSSTKMEGTFTFYRKSVDPLFEHYALLDINWTVAIEDTTGTTRLLHLSGSGTYDLGGEVARTQRLTLDVLLEGHGPLHFDSGLETPPVGFPAIDATAFLHGNACHDTALRVLAAPLGFSDVGAGREARMLGKPVPNPFARGTQVSLVLARPSHARIDVLDVDGRVVARLADGMFTAGEHLIVWNGKGTSGRDAGPGVFWIRVRAGAAMDQRRIVRIR